MQEKQNINSTNENYVKLYKIIFLQANRYTNNHIQSLDDEEDEYEDGQQCLHIQPDKFSNEKTKKILLEV